MPIGYNCDNTEKPCISKDLRAFECSFSPIFDGVKNVEKEVSKKQTSDMRQHFLLLHTGSNTVIKRTIARPSYDI